MTISELIELLESLKAEHGDLPTYIQTGGTEWDPFPQVTVLGPIPHEVCIL